MQHRRLLLVAALVALGTPVLADTVYLRDGQKLTNVKVTERADGRFEIETKLGARVVERLDVTSIERDGETKKIESTDDILYLVDGRVLRGNVTFSDDGKEIALTNNKGAESRFPRELVKSITFRKGKPVPAAAMPAQIAAVSTNEETEKKWAAQLDACIARLRDPLNQDPRDKKKARNEILDLGIFAVNYVRSEIAKVDSNDTVVRPVLEEVLKIAEFKAVVPAKVEEAMPGICEKLIEKDPLKRMEAINKIALDCPDDAAPLLLHLIKTDPAAKVKSICVGQLSMLKRYDELSQVLKMHEHGQWRLVAALELGDAGIYVGIPVLIEALKLDGAQFRDVRALSIEKLKAWTHQGNLGYLPEAEDKAERDASVGRWEAWWQAEGQNWAEKNSRIESATVSDGDKSKALDLWRDGNKVIADLQKKQDDAAKAGKPALDSREISYAFETAAFIFKQSYDLDPTLSSARLSRAIILYEQLGRPREAEGELKLIVTRFAPENAKLLRAMATTHLARLAELESNWRRAENYWVEVRRLEPDSLDAYVGIGDSFLERALAVVRGEVEKEGEGKPNPPTPEDKQRLKSAAEDNLNRAVQAYKGGLEAVERKQKGLRDSVSDLGPASGEADDFKSSRLLMRIREDRDTLIKRAASIWFRLGRAESARPTGAKDALAAFKAARSLDPKDERYSKAAALWEKISGEGTDKP
ncbi:MAG: hypothetical protein ACAI25_01890 [Planctomycetota bacterium]